MNKVRILAPKIVPILVIYTGLLMFLHLTDPKHLSLVLFIFPFTLIFAGIYLPTKYFAIAYMRGLKGGELGLVLERRLRFISFLIAVVPTFLLILSTISQLTIKDFLLCVLLLLGLIFYTNRFRPGS